MTYKYAIINFYQKQSYENQTDSTLINPLHVAIESPNIAGIQQQAGLHRHKNQDLGRIGKIPVQYHG